MKPLMEQEAEIIGKLKRNLSRERFRHTLSVARWARALARLHGKNAERAWLAGLLHDCAKEWPGLRLSTVVRLHRLKVPGKDFILHHRRFNLFHAHVSAWWAQKEFGVRDRAVISAIARHTLGDENMSPLDKILYVADFSAPQRGYASAARVRRLARRDLDAGFRECVRLKLLHVIQSGNALHPQTVSLWNNGLGRKGT